MKRFTITGIKTIDVLYTYMVEAEDEDTAIEMVESGEIKSEEGPQYKPSGYDEEFYIETEEEI